MFFCGAHLARRPADVVCCLQRNLHSRSTVTIEDLGSKKGTLLNGTQIRGQKKTLSQDVNEVQLGLCSQLVR